MSMVLPQRNLLLQAYRNRSGPDLPFRMEELAVPLGTVLYEAGEYPRFLHFITSGAASIVAPMPDGDLIETGFVGDEGFPESVFLLGPQTGARRCVMQVEGTALRVRLREFQECLSTNALLQRLTLRWAQYEALALSQLAACNGLHRVEQRLARWLLTVQDRVRKRDLPLTQDLLGQMLGARRPTVTQAAGNLERAGILDWRRGHITIQNRDSLEEVACPCYRLIRNLYDRIYE